MHRSFSVMRLSDKALLLVLLVLFWGDINRMAESQISRPVNHLPGTIVYDMVQDIEGNLWFGSENGLIRFDGHGFRRFSTADGLPGNTILYVEADHAGRVWALDFTGSVSFVKQGNVHTPQSDPLLREAVLPGLVHTTIFTDADTAWVGWEMDRIMRFDREGYQFLNHPKKYVFSVRHIAKDRRGNIVIASLDTLSLFPPNQPHPSRAMAKKFSPGRVFYYRGVPYAPFGTAWQRMEFRDEPVVTPDSDPIPWVNPATETIKFPQPEIRGRMFTAVELPEGFIAVGTTEGLYFISPDPAVPVKDELEGMFINRVLEDKQGNVWASTLDSGVFMFPAGFWKTSGFEATEAGLTSLRSVSILPNGSLLFGTASDRFALFQNNRLTVNLLPGELESSFGLQLLLIDFWGDDIVLASAEKIYIGPLNEDAQLNFRNGLFYKVGGAKRIHVVSENRMYIAASSGVVQVDRQDNGTFSVNHLNFARTTAIAYHPGTGIIAGRSLGLWVAEGETLTPIFPELANAQITEILLLEDDVLLIATNGFGLWKANLETNRLRNMFPGDSRLNSIRDLSIDETGSWWIATSAGVYHYDVSTGQLSLRDTGNIRQIAARNGSLAYITSDVAVITNAAPFERSAFELTFSHPVLIADKDRIPLIPASSASAVPGFQGNARSFESVSLPFGTRVLQLDTSAPYFGTKGLRGYFYRLYPNDIQWQYTENPDFTFRGLRPGRYRLYLRAVASGGETASALVFPFSIEAPFWQKAWFITIMLLLASGLIALVINRQLKQIEKREQAKLRDYQKTVELEQQALTAMMNPHFVFNVLNAIRQFMANREDGKADEYLQLFARLIRLQLEATFRKKITLREELELLTMYAGLEKIRIRNPFEFQISLSEEVQEECDEIEIPPMLIQPFLENAIIHGIQPLDVPGFISLHVALKDPNSLIIELKDSGQGIKQRNAEHRENHKSLAIALIRQRLELLHPREKAATALQIVSSEGEGTRVRIEVPV